MDFITTFSAVKEGVKAGLEILKIEYSLYRQNTIKEKEKFKDSNKKLKVSTSSSIVLMENAIISSGSKPLFNARTLADNVSKIAYELDRVAEESRGILPKELCNATKDLSRSFSKWQTELNVFKLHGTNEGMSSNVGLEENQKFQTYSSKEMLDILKDFYNSLEDLE